MPIYEYRCGNGHTFEVMQRMTDDPLTSCSTCDAPVERVFHPVAVHFKGSGFYSTDYGSKQPSGTSDSTSDAKDSKETKDSKDSKAGSESGSGSGESDD
jgi:putative FmdB family regulatory protein